MREIPGIFEAQNDKKPKVVFCIPIPKNQWPHAKTIESLEKSVPLVEAAGWEHGFTYTSGNPYISGARADMTRKALDAHADVIVYIDYDVSWDAQDMVSLLKTQGDVVGGTYRCKTDAIQYMGAVYSHESGERAGTPITRADGCIKARVLPAGFLKVSAPAIDWFMRSYPEMCYGPQYSLSVDLFHHGAHKGLWWGEDYAFSRNWEACGGEIWLIPNMNIHHWDKDKCFAGNFHEYMLRQPGGSKAA